jgi:hypothetical protein
LEQAFHRLAVGQNLVDYRCIRAVATTGRGQRVEDNGQPPSFMALRVPMIGRVASQRAAKRAPVAFEQIGSRIDREGSSGCLSADSQCDDRT